MKKVEIVCIVDRSGSMSNIKTDAIGGFNQFLAAQQALPGEANFTLVLFDDRYETPQNAIDLKAAEPMTDATFVPRGGTALFDAVGRTIDALGQRFTLSDVKPEKVIVAILTDGEENSSREYTQSRISGMIRHQESKYGWEFIFLAANQDAFAAGAQLGIKLQNTANFAATGQGVRDAYAATSCLVGNYRNS